VVPSWRLLVLREMPRARELRRLLWSDGKEIGTERVGRAGAGHWRPCPGEDRVLARKAARVGKTWCDWLESRLEIRLTWASKWEALSPPASIKWRRGRESNPRIPVLQTSALPLCYLARRFVCEAGG